MQSIFLLTHVIFGVLFMLLVLIQDKGVGFGGVIGGASASGGFYATQRGAAKFIHRLSILFAVLFVVSALLYVVAPVPVPPASTDTGDISGTPVDIPVDVSNIDIESTPVKE